MAEDSQPHWPTIPNDRGDPIAVPISQTASIPVRQEAEGSEEVRQAQPEKEAVDWRPTCDPIETDWPTYINPEEFNTPDPVWVGMPRADFKRAGEFLRFAADRLGLRDWAFNLKWQPCEDNEAMASVTCVEGQKRANITLSRTFADYPWPEQRKALIHELLHCHFEPVCQVLWSAEPHLGMGAFNILDRNHHMAIEYAVDAIAHEVAGFFPYSQQEGVDE
jgi:hypothetical protein